MRNIWIHIEIWLLQFAKDAKIATVYDIVEISSGTLEKKCEITGNLNLFSI